MIKLKKMNRTEMKSIIGGKVVASCSADCGGGKSVVCNGPSCTSEDGKGCSAGSGSGAVSLSC